MSTSSPCLRDDTRKKQSNNKRQLVIAFLLRALLLMCVAFRLAASLTRALYTVAIGSVGLLFAAANAACLRCIDGRRSVTGTACGDFVVAAMAHSWRVLLQGITSLVFLCAHADEYVRPPPSPLVLVPHDKPAAHPQQVKNYLQCFVLDSEVAFAAELFDS